MLAFRCTDAPLPCDLPLVEPQCVARTLRGGSDVETRNGLLHLVDRPLLPPPVTLALYAAGHRPYADSPPPPDPPPACAFLPAGAPGSLPLELPGGAFFQ